jgi:hypothetical protein
MITKKGERKVTIEDERRESVEHGKNGRKTNQSGRSKKELNLGEK